MIAAQWTQTKDGQHEDPRMNAMNTNEKQMAGKQHAKPHPASTYYYITLYF
jgi:hypothetical protein